jgi:hypothetical protein
MSLFSLQFISCEKVICLSVLAWFSYPEKAYQGHLIVLVDKTNMFSMKTIEWS